MTDIDRSDEVLDWYAEENPDGAQLLYDLYDTITRYVVFANRHQAIAVTLWIAATHGLPAWQHATRLAVTSPQKRCGKSRLLDIVAGTCHWPLLCVNATPAAIFRSIGANEDKPPTLIVDEADALFGTKRIAEQNEDLRALFNAGFGRNRPALRCVGPLQTPTEFATFAMAALAAIGRLPDTITDRAVNIDLQRRSSDEPVSQFRTRRDSPRLVKLRDRLSVWVKANIDALREMVPDLPVEDREADAWEPLVAVADAAGGSWPKRARSACVVLTESAAEDDEAIMLLTDIRDVFAESAQIFFPSQLLVNELRNIEESPWRDEELNPSKLAQRLKPFGVKPRHNAAKTVRGYALESFRTTFKRYLRPESSDRPKQAADQDEQAWTEKTVTRPLPVPPVRTGHPGRVADGYAENGERPKNAGQSAISDDWTGTDGTPAPDGTQHETSPGLQPDDRPQPTGSGQPTK